MGASNGNGRSLRPPCGPGPHTRPLHERSSQNPNAERTRTFTPPHLQSPNGPRNNNSGKRRTGVCVRPLPSTTRLIYLTTAVVSWFPEAAVSGDRRPGGSRGRGSLSRGRDSDVRVPRGHAPSRGSGEGPSHLFQLLGTPGVSWFVARIVMSIWLFLSLLCWDSS